MSDLAFLVDGSSSVGEDDFIMVKAFILNVINGFKISPKHVQVGLTQYSDAPKVEFSLSQGLEGDAIAMAVRAIRYLEGSTQTGLALQHVLDRELNVARVRRPEAIPLVVVITDGASQDDVAPPSLNAQALGVDIFAVAVTRDINEKELEVLTNTKPNRIFRVERFRDLQQEISNKLVDEVCKTLNGDVESQGGMQILCDSDSISIQAETRNPFQGRVFVKGFSDDPECVQSANEFPPNTTTIKFAVPANSCGMRRIRQISPPGMAYEATVVISFHPYFITKVDRAFRIRCFFMEASKTVRSDLEVSMIPTEEKTVNVPMPVCTYSIRSGSPTGPVTRYAKIGDKTYHVWECSSENDVYAMLVHSCYVDDGRGRTIQILDNQGCMLDEFVLANLIYDESLRRAHQETHAFKFADQPSLFFNCAVTLCIKEDPQCNQLVPPICSVTKKPTLVPTGSPSPPQPTTPTTVTPGYVATPFTRAPQPPTFRPPVPYDLTRFRNAAAVLVPLNRSEGTTQFEIPVQFPLLQDSPRLDLYQKISILDIEEPDSQDETGLVDLLNSDQGPDMQSPLRPGMVCVYPSSVALSAGVIGLLGASLILWLLHRRCIRRRPKPKTASA